MLLQISYDMSESVAGLLHLWSAETPHLYVLVLSLVDKSGAHVESESCQVGSKETSALRSRSESLATAGQRLGVPKHLHIYKHAYVMLLAAVFACVGIRSMAMGDGPPPFRRHSVTQNAFPDSILLRHFRAEYSNMVL